MPAKSAETTKAEFNVLKALWQLKQGTVAEVRKELTARAGTEPAYTTVMTLLSRLDVKGLVRVDKTREPFVYKPRHKEASVLRDRLKQFIDTVFAGNASELLLQLVDDETISAQDLRRIEAKIAAKEREAKAGTP